MATCHVALPYSYRGFTHVKGFGHTCVNPENIGVLGATFSENARSPSTTVCLECLFLSSTAQALQCLRPLQQARRCTFHENDRNVLGESDTSERVFMKYNNCIAARSKGQTCDGECAVVEKLWDIICPNAFQRRCVLCSACVPKLVTQADRSA